jgi:hypothetical protein
MRRTMTLFRTGLAGAAAIAMMSACGGGSSDDSASSSSSTSSETTSSSSSESSAPEADSEFCQQAAGLQTQLATTPDLSDPAAAAPAFQQIADAVRAIDPPQQIASDWGALADGLEQIGQLFATTDFNDPNQAAAAEQQITQMESTLASASTNVETYLTDQCGIDTSGDTAAPTS